MGPASGDPAEVALRSETTNWRQLIGRSLARQLPARLRFGSRSGVAMASSTLRRAARRAGPRAARTPARAARPTMTVSCRPGTTNVVTPSSPSALVMPQAPPTARTKPRAVPSSEMSTDSQRIARAHLAAGHAHRPEQAELTGPLVHRQRQGVGDADQGDDHGEGEQAVDQVEHHVDLRRDGLLEAGLVLQLGVRPLRRGPPRWPPSRWLGVDAVGDRSRRPAGRTGR